MESFVRGRPEFLLLIANHGVGPHQTVIASWQVWLPAEITSFLDEEHIQLLGIDVFAYFTKLAVEVEETLRMPVVEAFEVWLWIQFFNCVDVVRLAVDVEKS